MLYDVITGLPVGVLQLIALAGGLLLYHMVSRALRKRSLMFHVDAHKDCFYVRKHKPHIGLNAVASSANGSHRSVSLIITSQENSNESR